MKILKHYLKGLKGVLLKILKYLAIAIFCLLYIYAESDFDLDYLEDMGINLNPNDYCNLTDVDYTAILHDDPDGNAHVAITEYLTFDVHAASKNNPFKELWRELPEDNVDGLPVTYTVHSVTQILDDGTEIPYTETSKMFWEDYDYQKTNVRLWHHSKASGRYPDNDESLLMYIPWTYRDTLKFKIEYNLNNAALRYNDCSELYLSMYSGNTITKLKSYKGQILVPNNIMPKEYYAYTFGTKNSRIPFEESDSINPGYHTFSFRLNQSELKFQHNDRYIEFCLLAYGNDKHIFTKYAPSNNYTRDDVLQECIDENEKYSTLNKRYGTIKFFLLISSIVITVLIVDNSKKKIQKIKEDNKFYKPEIDYEYFRDIPSDLDPIFAADLVFSKDPFNDNNEKKEEYAAILLSLTRKKYVTLRKNDETSDWSVYNTVIELNVKPEYKDKSMFTSYARSIDTYNNYNENIPYFTTSQDQNTTQTNTINNQDTIYSGINSTNNTSTPSDITETNDVIQGSKIINILEGSIFKDGLEPLTTSEKLYLDLLIRHSKTQNYVITLGKFQSAIDIDYEYSDAFIKNMDKKPALEVGLVQGYYQTAAYDKPKKDILKQSKTSIILGLIMLTLVNLISFFTPLYFAYGAYTLIGIALLYRAIYFNIKSNDLLLLTQYGEDERAKWYGLYKFLDSETLINEKEVHDLVIWEKYLIYATAFGISEKVIKAIKLHAPEINIDNSPILSRNSYIHSRSFHATSRSFGHSIHTVSHGGHGGHFGYGGGGRGGGGGGGGH